ncbi:MAG: succinate dehydrogenase hydrophobic membrane anchor subunit [Terriglobia bacterium]|jgi:succinate dehydrogenase / fumarate reductase membrane anchor subunit
MNEAGRPRPESGLELYAWMFMRVSGVVLLFLALGHLLIMHIIHNVDNIDFQFVAQRYATPFWRTYDLVMLWLALIHGLNGIRTLVGDYVRPKGWQVATLASLYVFGFILLALGSLTIMTFQPPG